jgi:hypothetical protein
MPMNIPNPFELTAERLGFSFEGILGNDARHVDGTLRNTCVFAQYAGVLAESDEVR